MDRRFIPLVLLLFTSLFMLEVTPAQENEEDYQVKVMTYNIYQSGAIPEYFDVLTEENADVLLLVETGTWDDERNQTLNRVTRDLNNYFEDEEPYAAYTDQITDYPTTGVAILSRFPMTNISEVFELDLDDNSTWYATHDMVVATLDIHGWDVAVAVSHLKCCGGDFNEQRRENEQEGFNNFFDTLGDVPLIYGGDLNAYAPGEGISLGSEPVEMVVNASHTQASELHQFTDVHRELNPDDEGYTYESGGRIDYIFTNQHVTPYLINSTTGDTASAEGASDHYSVDVFLDLSHLMPEPTTETSTEITTTSTTSSTTSTSDTTSSEQSSQEVGPTTSSAQPSPVAIIPAIASILILSRKRV